MIEIEAEAVLSLDDWSMYLPFQSEEFNVIVTLYYDIVDHSFDYAGTHCTGGVGGTHIDIQSELIGISIHQDNVICMMTDERLFLSDDELAHYENVLLHKFESGVEEIYASDQNTLDEACKSYVSVY